MKTFSLHADKAMATALAAAAIAADSSIRATGGKILDAQVAANWAPSSLASTTGAISDSACRLPSWSHSARRVLSGAKPQFDESCAPWVGLFNLLDKIDTALTAANEELARTVDQKPEQLKALQSRAAAALARTHGPKMNQEILSAEKLQLGNVAIATGALTDPLRIKPLTKK